MTILVCPKCQAAPCRRQVGRRTLCVGCWQATRHAKWRATSAHRSQLRLAARGVKPFICPRCQQDPPRMRPRSVMGRVPLCQRCFDARWAHEYAQRAARSDDIPAAEIERRFQVALQQIRSRTWTSAQRS